MSDEIPNAIASSELHIAGVKLRCHVLDNGQRVIDAEDAARFFRALESREIRITADDFHDLAKFCHGK